MLKIRLQRVGRKHEPSFRLVLTDSKNSTKSGRFAEMLGNYDPRKSIEALKADRIKHWLANGAGVTGSVNNLLVKKGLLRGKKVHVGMDNVVKEAPAPVVESTSTETPVETVEETPIESSEVASSDAKAPAPEAAPASEEVSSTSV